MPIWGRKQKQTHVLCLRLRWTFFCNEQQAQRANCEASNKLSTSKYQSDPHCSSLACSTLLDNYTKYLTALINNQECFSTVFSSTNKPDSKTHSTHCWQRRLQTVPGVLNANSRTCSRPSAHNKTQHHTLDSTHNYCFKAEHLHTHMHANMNL